MYHNFVDFRKACDSIHQASLWKIVKLYGVNILKLCYQNYECTVKLTASTPRWFDIKTSVRQGCVISPFLFVIVTDFIMKKLGAVRTSALRWTLTSILSYLAYADDICLISATQDGISKATRELNKIASMVGNKINAEKTKVMRVQPSMEQPPVVTDSLQREYVEDFRYLGAIVTSTGGASTDVITRIRSAGSAYGMLRNIWRFSSITKKVKVKVFNSNVLSVHFMAVRLGE